MCIFLFVWFWVHSLMFVCWCVDFYASIFSLVLVYKLVCAWLGAFLCAFLCMYVSSNFVHVYMCVCFYSFIWVLSWVFSFFNDYLFISFWNIKDDRCFEWCLILLYVYALFCVSSFCCLKLFFVCKNILSLNIYSSKVK